MTTTAQRPAVTRALLAPSSTTTPETTMSRYHCDDCDHSFDAPTDTETCRCGCGERAWREDATDAIRPTRAEIAEQIRVVRAAQDKFGALLDAAMPAASSAPADQNLRDRLRHVLAREIREDWGTDRNGPLEGDEFGDMADAVLAVLPAPANEAPPLLAEVWTVWCEDESTWGYFATEDTGKTGTIDYYEEQEERCPDYGWRQDGPRLELLAGGETTGIYLSRHPVYGKPAPDGRASEWRAAAVELDKVSDLFDADNCTCGDCTICTWKEAANHLRRMAGEVQQAGEGR